MDSETRLPDPQYDCDRIRRCGTLDTDFFDFLEWLNEQPAPEV
jgi:hypothetical protein